jgi:ribonuclease HI
MNASLFPDSKSSPKPSNDLIIAHCDGGSRGNPGPAGYGALIEDQNGRVLARLSEYLGKRTNNYAEYSALLGVLAWCLEHKQPRVRVVADSELMVKQMQGQYKVKSEDLRPLFERAKKMSMGFDSFRIDHIYREQNREADALANEALDETSGVPGAAGAPAKAVAPDAKPGPRWIQARFRSGILYPLEDIDLPDGTEVQIVLRPLKRQTPTK